MATLPGTVKNQSEYVAILTSMTIYYILSSVLSDQYDPLIAFSSPFYIAILSYVESKLYNIHSECGFVKRKLEY